MGNLWIFLLLSKFRVFRSVEAYEQCFQGKIMLIKYFFCMFLEFLNPYNGFKIQFPKFRYFLCLSYTKIIAHALLFDLKCILIDLIRESSKIYSDLYYFYFYFIFLKTRNPNLNFDSIKTVTHYSITRASLFIALKIEKNKK